MKDVTTTIASSNDTTETHPPINDHGVLLSNDTTTITLIAKFGKECIELTDLSPEITVGQVKEALFTRTRVLPIRQKLIGLVAGAGNRPVTDDVPLRDLKVKNTSGKNHYKDANKPIITHHCILMGTPEEEIFIDPHHRDDLPDVVDDFDLDFNAGSAEWYQHVANGENLKKFTEHTQIHIMHHPRPGMPLLVLDLDHTLLDFSSKILLTRHDADPGTMKRPHMDAFLTQCYQHYDLVVWSQTSWRWLETKLIELGMLTNAGYRFCFVLDKTSMFQIVSTNRRDGTSRVHHVKPLQIIWTKFEDRWGVHNTVHVDDLARNFALNPLSGIQCTPYRRKKSKQQRDTELVGIGTYLVQLARANVSFELVDFQQWRDVIQGKRPLFDPSTVQKSSGANKDF